MNNKNNQEIDIKISDTSKVSSIFIGLSFLNISFYHFSNIIGNTIIGIVFLAYGLISIKKWNCLTKNRIKSIKWSIILMILAVIPMQIYFFVTTKNNIYVNILYIIVILNISADLLVIALLISMKKILEAGEMDE